MTDELECMKRRIAAQAACALMEGLDVEEVSIARGVVLADGTRFGGMDDPGNLGETIAKMSDNGRREG